jgi:hypothetical protein
MDFAVEVVSDGLTYLSAHSQIFRRIDGNEHETLLDI